MKTKPFAADLFSAYPIMTLTNIDAETKPSTANAVWVALAVLHKESPNMKAFRAKDIARKIKELNIQSASDATVITHISSHCVANKPAQPDTHKKIVRIRQGWYRLYVEGDPCDDTRENGQAVPLPEMLPERFRDLINWYHDDYVKREHEKGENPAVYCMMEIPKNYNKPAEFTLIDTNNMIRIPEKIMKELNLKSGDHLGLVLYDDCIIIKKAKVTLEL